MPARRPADHPPVIEDWPVGAAPAPVAGGKMSSGRPPCQPPTKASIPPRRTAAAGDQSEFRGTGPPHCSALPESICPQASSRLLHDPITPTESTIHRPAITNNDQLIDFDPSENRRNTLPSS